MTKAKFNKYKVTIHLITNEKLFGSDWECDYYHLWADDYTIFIEAPSIQEALEEAKERAIKKGEKWSSVTHNEEFKSRHYHCHSIQNDEYTDKLQELYG